MAPGVSSKNSALSSASRPAVFLDRDGVLNIDTHYPYRPEDLVLVKGAGEALAFLKALGYLLIVVSNQSGVARGLFSEQQVQDFNALLQARLAEKGGAVDAYYYCPYHPQGVIESYSCEHPDRKPNPGMLLKAIKTYSIDPRRSFLIGDKKTDLAAAQAASIKGYLFNTGNLNVFVRSLIKTRQGQGL